MSTNKANNATNCFHDFDYSARVTNLIDQSRASVHIEIDVNSLRMCERESSE
jgi:hypothetical protein